jgi:hypothetical protein
MHGRDKTKPKIRIGNSKDCCRSQNQVQARAIANDCYRYIMDRTNAGLVSDALEFIGKKERRNSLTLYKK